MKSPASIESRVARLREKLAGLSWAAYVVWGTDPHESEYVAERWRTRPWLTGFTGSAGTVVVTSAQAGLWTDGRYHLQAENQLAGTPFVLFREGLPDTPTIVSWLGSILPPGAIVGVAAETTTSERYRRLSDDLKEKGLRLEAGPDPLDSIWDDRPEAPDSSVWDYQALVAVESRTSKLQRLRSALKNQQAQAFLATALDDVAWLFNLRGSDVLFNPVFLAYALVDVDRVLLFTNPDRVESDAGEALAKDGVEILSYAEVQSVLAEWPAGRALCLAPDKTNLALVAAVERSTAPQVVWAQSPVARLKSVKSESELDLVRKAHQKDGAALVEFLTWFSDQTPDGDLTELGAARKLDEFRSRQGRWKGPSFDPIPGFREHGAVIHYKVEEGEGSPLKGRGLFLLDTGAQYLEGTTDVTRTLILGNPDPEEIEDYTLVLKAHVQVAITPFPRGSRGYMIDALARRPLWKRLRQYNHGTGHGVGHFLGVHEGPQRLNSEPLPTVLEPGMVLSNEPGLYRAGRYGVRLENLVVVRSGPKSDFADFLEWETLTLCPFEKRLIDAKLLEPDERAWIDAYHRRVREELSPHLSPDAQEWLQAVTGPLVNS